MRANSGWGLLGFAVSFALAVLSLSPELTWLQPYLLGAAVLCGITGLICFAWPLFPGGARATLMIWATVLIVAGVVAVVVGVMLVSSTWSYGSREPPVPIDEATLNEYVRRSELVRRLDKDIADKINQTVDYQYSLAYPALQSLRILGIHNLAYLDRLLDENDEAILRLSLHSVPTRVCAGHCVLYLGQLLAASLGPTRFRELWSAMRNTRGSGDGILEAYQRINSYPFRKKATPATNALIRAQS